MTRREYLRACLPLLLIIGLPVLANATQPKVSTYFDLGPRLIQEFRGTHEFKYKRVEYVRATESSYVVTSSGDQSPARDELRREGNSVRWVLGGSGETWLFLKVPINAGASWSSQLRGWNQRYKVTSTKLSVSVPAGEFQGCARVTVSWIANEHDLKGPQRVVLYLAPHLGIIKREYWNSSTKEHEEVLTSYSRKPDT
jgi:hypothetical protein